MPKSRKKFALRNGWLFTVGAGVLCAAVAGAQVIDQPAPPKQEQPVGGIPGLNGDSFYGKEPTDGVYVRDSAGAVEKLALAQKMEKLKEWSKSADLYQEVIVKYADRVVPSQLDKDKKIYQYTSITGPVQERLARWPSEGLDVYRARFETPAQTMLDAARPDDAAAMNRVYSLYFVTEAGRQAGIRLIDLYIETGEYPAAAWMGDRLLALHPNLVAERSAVLYRTALAYYYGGDQAKAKDRLAELKSRFAGDRGIVRGKDVLLADSLAQEIQAPIVSSSFASADSWPTPWGDLSRGRVSTAEGRPGARLYGIQLSKPNWPTNPPQRDALQKQYESAMSEGQTLGILPVTDRGELFFQDGQRMYGMSLELGVPLPGWAKTYPSGSYLLPGVWGSPRFHQLSVTLTDHEMLGIMGQLDQQQAQLVGIQPSGEPRLVCLDRETGREKWIVGLSQLPEQAKDERTLAMTGSPLVIGDSALVIAHGAKTQFEDCYVLAFDLATGKFRWATYIASASSGMMAWNGMGVQSADVDSASHLAYANGRVYVQTNLGALAAIDAYTGAVVWLDIYPTGRQTNERFNPFMQNGAPQAPEHRPWAFNPVMVQDGVVFTLPSEGRNLLIYDAANGTEIKRIDVKTLEEKAKTPSGNAPLVGIDTLVGVLGDNLILTGEKGYICINWKKYTADAFDPARDDITVWIGPSAQPIRGRSFLTRDAVYIPEADRVLKVDMSNGKCVAEYPKHPNVGAGGWEAPEESGNVLATNDHVIIAGARYVNVYTDLTLAKAKLDKELALAPADPEPRLKYAEITFVAGEPDTAAAKLDEAIALLGGIKSIQSGPVRDRLFVDSLKFADKLSKSTTDEDRERGRKLFDRASAAADSPVQQVKYRMMRAAFDDSTGDYTAAVALYQEILADRQLRAVPMLNDANSQPLQADSAAEKAIAAIIKDHPSVYESFQQAASAAMEQAAASKDDPAGKLLELSRMYPNSAVAGKAMIAAAETYEAAGDSRHAIRVLNDMWFRFPDSPDKAKMQEAIARNDLVMSAAHRESAGDWGPRDNMEAAAAALARAAALPNNPKLERDLKLRDGTVIAAGTSISSALDAVRKFRGNEVARSLPDLRIPLPGPRVQGHRQLPFLAANADQDTLAGIKSLIIPVRDFGRSDRVVAFGADGALNILAGGQVKPAVSSHSLTEEPRSCAWVDNELLVWGPSQLASINGANGQVAWKIDLKSIAGIEVVRIGDSAQAIPSERAEPDVIFVNQNIRQLQIRGGQRVIFRGGRALPPPPPPAAAAPPRPAPANGEEIVDVRPVGDHVLLTTTSGRILSAELSNGHIAWQTRLSDRPVDRLVANEDFTVVRVTDDTSVRLAAFDTATGQMRSTRSWVVQSGMVPVNIALAADDTLVYTLPDRLCLKDLYRPWPDPSDKEVQANQGAQLFEKATQPDQLVIAEGRILALADDGAVKYVRVHSLETGQPIPLRYHTADGDKEVDRVLTAGKSEQVSLRVVGSHLYAVNPYGIYAYDLDHPADTWKQPWEDSIGPDDRLNVRDSFIDQKFIVLLSEPPVSLDAGAPIPVGAVNPRPGIGPAPAVPQTQPAVEPQAVANGAASVDAQGAAAKTPQFRLQVIGRYPISVKKTAEVGRIDYEDTFISDPAGISPNWQGADGGLYYLTGDSKLHILRGSQPEK